MTSGRRAAAFGFVVLLATACARPASPRLPEGEDYVFPVMTEAKVQPEERRRVEKAWRQVLAGDVTGAEKEYRTLLREKPGFLPAETGLGYAWLRGGRLPQAGATFEAVLARQPEYFPALVGAASTAQRRGDPEAALSLYRRAQAAQPGDTTVRRRLGEVKLQITERRVAAGRAALEAGEAEKAIEEYRLALEAAPEVGGLRLELAHVLISRGDPAGAADVLEADPTSDRQVLGRLGEILLGLQEYGRALEAYRRILARDPRDQEARSRSQEAREALELLRMPEEYRRILSAPRITRADLAALISVKVTALARIASREPRVAIDISGSWAREHVASVLALDIMDVYPNHTFQPGATVRRGDLARAVARVLELFRWNGAPAPAAADMTVTNLYYEAAMKAVGAGLMDLTPESAFEPWRPVGGREANDTIEALVRLVGP